MTQTIIERRKDGIYVERLGLGKFFPVEITDDLPGGNWLKCEYLAESFAIYLERFTDPIFSLAEFQGVFLKLKAIVSQVEDEFPYEGVEGFADGDYTYFARFEDQAVGVQFGALNVYVDKNGLYIMEMITQYYNPRKTAIVCSGVSAETVVAILKTSPRSQTYKDPVLKQLYFSESNLAYFNSVRATG